MKQKMAGCLPIVILGVFASLGGVDAAKAAPIHPMAPPIAVASALLQPVVQGKAPSLNGYRGYSSSRPGYIKALKGYWYPSRAFSSSGDYTGSVGHPQRLNNACNYGFTPTNGSSRCNY